MEDLKATRTILKTKLTKFQTFVNKVRNVLFDNSPTSEEIIDLQTRLERARPLLDEFEEINRKILLTNNLDSIDFDQQEEFEEKYFTITACAEAMLKRFSLPTQNVGSNVSCVSSTNSNNYSPMRLPVINLTKFNGDIENWMEFKEIFTSLIHNNPSIDDIQKLHYLKASLTGEAAMLIKSLEFTASNYIVSWDSLNERYNNPKMLIYNHIKAILEIEPSNKESSSKLRNLNDTLFKHVTALKTIASETELFEAFIIQVTSKKLDSRTARDWEVCKNRSNSNLPALKDFKDFLKNNADLLESLESKHSNKFVDNKSNLRNTRSLVSGNVICSFCKGSHQISQCEEFLKTSPQERSTKIKELKLCLNCLAKGHYVSQCQSKFSCRKCRSRHHTILHFDSSEPKERVKLVSDQKQGAEVPSASSSTISAFCSNANNSLLPTATAKIIDSQGNSHPVRILLDSGSQSNFISTSLCQRLRIPTKNVNVSVHGLSEVNTKIKSSCFVHLRANQSSYELKLHCLVLDTITSVTPSMRINPYDLKIPTNIQLSDPNFCQPGDINLLIGSSVFWNLLSIGQIKLGPNLPIIQKTRLGWVVAGPLQNLSEQVQCNFSRIDDSFDMIARFWQFENYPNEKVNTPEETSCEVLFQNTTHRDPNGRFIVSLPLKQPPEVLGDSFEVARKRFLSLEHRLKSKPELYRKYVSFMNEYKTLGHMTPVSPKSEISFYLPHHGVLKEESLTTKLRVVFNGSNPSSTGHSLNSIQMIGPTIQQDLFSILIRFRKHAYAISADIEKMYRQVQIEPNQRPLQRILWRASPDEPLQVYELNTVTYGTAAASFLAIRSLFQLGIECESSNPEVARIIKEDFYVDDLLTGSDNIKQAQEICSSLLNVLQTGCFKLRKWLSNNPDVLQNISQNDVHPILELDSKEQTKTLSLTWSVHSDCLMYRISSRVNSQSITKRKMLSELCQIFDPLGLLGPCIVKAKMILQQLWLEKLTWDDLVPDSVLSKWLKFYNELSELNNLKIPRHVLLPNYKRVELHGFSDASLQAYGACIYLISFEENDIPKVELLCAKTRVSPLKPTTIPRLELCGAVLLSKLAESVLKSININISKITLWSDSTIVLSWLKLPPKSLKTFVCNRVADILDTVPNANWRYVPTEFNPSDLLTRGVSPSVLINNDLWWHGPSWLKDDEASWPQIDLNKNKIPELKDSTQVNCSTVSQTSFFSNFSKLSRLQRTVAYCLRFRHNCALVKQGRTYGPLSTKELQNSLMVLVKLAQHESFPEEIKCLQQNKNVKTSALKVLTPFLDSDGLLRVGGRLANSSFSYNKKHPLLLSGKHALSNMIVTAEHLRLLHAGPQLMASSIRDKFWITSCRNLAKNITRSCITCFRHAPNISEPIMSNLPVSRTMPNPPFHSCGVDYAGPLFIKDRKGRGCKTTKVYICLFVCFTTKAVHMYRVRN